MAKRLTDKFIQSLEPPKTGRLVIADAVEGLSLRITEKDARSWLVRYRPKRHAQRAVVLGPYPTVSLAEARARASEIVAAAKRGVDLIAEEKRQAELDRQARERARTVKEVGEDYLAACKKHMRSWRHVDSRLRNHIIPAFGDKMIGDVRRADVVELLDKLEHDRGLKHQTNRVRETLLALFGFAVERQYVESNPVSDTRRRKIERPRDRILTRDEIAALWRALDETLDPVRSFVRTLILTGCRREEARAMRWDELDLERDHIWLIPAGRTKGARAHEILLSDPMLEILNGLPRRGPFVFTHHEEGKRPIAGLSGIKERLDRDSKVAGWRLHDLRRTLRSGLAELGVSYEVAERVIGHALPSLERTYNVHSYRTEKAQALQRWAEHVLALAEGRGAKVVTLRPSA